MAMIGVDYFPEQWPRERWLIDVAMLKEAGLSVVRIAEFTWSALEPESGRYDWSWLDDAIEVITNAGLQVIVCTPTACPPPWMVDEDPSILPEVRGRFMQLAGRRHYSPHHDRYTTACRRIAADMAERYAPNANVIGFQIDNELSGATIDTGPLAQSAFATWLAERHGDLGSYNKNLGTIFWGGQITDWSQVTVPRPGTDSQPGIRSEFARFNSDGWVAFCKNQADVMRPHLQDHQVLTTNCFLFKWGFDIDWHDLMQRGGIDVFSLDNYIQSPSEGAFFNDIGRSLSNPYWILEQQCGNTQGQHLWPDRTGRITTDTKQAAARGAQVITYFRWRQALFGREQDHGAILDHHGEPGPIYDEVSTVAHSLANNPPPQPQPSIGVHFRWTDAWFCRDGGEAIDYLDVQQNKVAQAIHTIKREARYLFDADADLSGLDLILLPLGVQFDPAWEEKLSAWVKQGGQILTMPLFGAKDAWNAYVPAYRSSTMTELTGTSVQRRIPVRTGHHTTASLNGELLSPIMRLEELQLSEEAEVVAHFTAEPLDGAPFLVSHPIEQGRAWTIAGYLEGKELAVILRHILD